MNSQTANEAENFARPSKISYYSPEEGSNNDGIKNQIKAHLDQIGALAPVVRINDIDVKGKTNKQIIDMLIKSLGSKNYTVDRAGFGEILVGEKEITESLNRYAKTDAERASLIAVPKVLKRGIELPGHSNHKDRGYSTKTFAAPVILNGKEGFLAVIVKQTGKNRYKAHRILMPDGSEFVLENNISEASQFGMAVQPYSEGPSTTSDTLNVSRGEGDVKNNTDKKDLMAIHNLNSNELIRQLDMGGLPMPSIAVTKPNIVSHDGFGDISLILKKDAIDPQKSGLNKVMDFKAFHLP